MSVCGQHHAPVAFTPGKKTRYSLYRRLGGPQSRSGRMRKISPLPGFDPRFFQLVAKSIYRLSHRGHYTLLHLFLNKTTFFFSLTSIFHCSLLSPASYLGDSGFLSSLHDINFLGFLKTPRLVQNMLPTNAHKTYKLLKYKIHKTLILTLRHVSMYVITPSVSGWWDSIFVI
jgi:hypothetical protein